MRTAREIVEMLLEGEPSDLSVPLEDEADMTAIDPRDLAKDMKWLANAKEFKFVRLKKTPDASDEVYVSPEDETDFDVYWKRQINKLTGKPVHLGTITVSHDRRGNPVWRVTYIAGHMGFFGTEYLLDQTFASRFGAARVLLMQHKEELEKAGTLDRVLSGS